MTGQKLKRMPENDIVAADVAAGLSNQQMAEKYGVSHHTIASHMYRHEIKRERKPVLPSDDIIMGLLRTGMSTQAMAIHLGVNRYTLRSRITKANLSDTDIPARLVGFSCDLRETAEKIVVERFVFSHESGVRPKRMLISLPRIKTLHGEFAP